MKGLLFSLAVLVGCANIEDQLYPELPSAESPELIELPAPEQSDSAQSVPPLYPACEDVCPDERWHPWYIGGVYKWSYCLPSYQLCSDATYMPYCTDLGCDAVLCSAHGICACNGQVCQ